MRTGADHGKREARHLACSRLDLGPRSNACDVAPPIPCRHGPRRLDDAQTVPNQLSMSAEDCTAHQDSKAGNGSTGGSPASVVYRGKAQVRIVWRAGDEDGRKEKKRPRLGLQDKSAAIRRTYVAGQVEVFRYPTRAAAGGSGASLNTFNRPSAIHLLSTSAVSTIVGDDGVRIRPGLIRHVKSVAKLPSASKALRPASLAPQASQPGSQSGRLFRALRLRSVVRDAFRGPFGGSAE